MDDRLWPDEQPAWERDLDAMVRPSFTIDPPADVQQSILAAVLQAAAPARVAVAAAPIPTAAQPIPLAAYLLLAAVLVTYVGALSWIQSLLGGAGWLPTLFNQLLAVSELVVGRPASVEPLALIQLLVQHAWWLALLPLAWLLWERDRAAARAA